MCRGCASGKVIIAGSIAGIRGSCHVLRGQDTSA
jgi:hypothetical protein